LSKRNALLFALLNAKQFILSFMAEMFYCPKKYIAILIVILEKYCGK